MKFIFFIFVLLASIPAYAILPCPSTPCYSSNDCESLIDTILVGSIILIKENGKGQEELPEIVLSPTKALKGKLPRGNITLKPFGMCWQRDMPKQKDMYPAQLRVYVRNFGQYRYLVFYEPLESGAWLAGLEKYFSMPNNRSNGAH